MVLHIVGAGPSGVTVAWYMAKRGEKVHLWEKRDLPGGSWWTPNHSEDADRHAARVLFRDCQPNWFNLLSEMGLDYNTYYKPDKDVVPDSIVAMTRSLTLRDHLITVGVLLCAGVNHDWAKTTVLDDALKSKMSPKGMSFINALTTSVDGVRADKMTVWELAESMNRTILSGAWTERVQGRKLGEDLARRLRMVGVKLHMGAELLDVEPPNVTFGGDRTVTLGDADKVVLCLDPSAALQYVDKFWDSTVDNVLYGTRSFLFKYPKRFKLPSAQESLMRSNNAFIPSWVPGEGETTTLHVADYKGEWKTMEQCVKTLGIPKPLGWRECEDTQDMSSAAWTSHSIPTQSNHRQVHMVGMLSPRDTPYASVEAAAEVAIRWCGERPLEPVKSSTIALILFTISLLTVV
jgi:hypothetical protein